MSRDTYPQAMSYICKVCGSATASRYRWCVDNRICEKEPCMGHQREIDRRDKDMSTPTVNVRHQPCDGFRD